MAFVAPIPLIRRNHIVSRLRKCGAVSEATAVTFVDAGVINPHAFQRVTELLVRRNVLGRTADGRYYLR